MKFRVEVVCVHADGAEQGYDVIEMERHQLAMEIHIARNIDRRKGARAALNAGPAIRASTPETLTRLPGSDHRILHSCGSEDQ